jgi:hypothetical protein
MTCLILPKSNCHKSLFFGIEATNTARVYPSQASRKSIYTVLLAEFNLGKISRMTIYIGL